MIYNKQFITKKYIFNFPNDNENIVIFWWWL